MTIGLVGKKCGMTRVFTEAGESIPVSVVEAQPNRVVYLKTEDSDGYDAVQVTTGSKRASKLTKAEVGHFAKAGVEAGRGLWEFRLDAGEGKELAAGTEIKADMFAEGAAVDVIGCTKGKGFAGVIKRHNFHMQDATHGNSLAHRAAGSIGQCQDPGRVFPGKKMAGHMGDETCTIQNQEVVSVDVDRDLILIKGAIPGAKGGDVIIKPAVKAKGDANAA